MRYVFVGAISLVCFTSSVSADESDCASFLSQDIHNKLIIIDNKNGKQVASSSLCKSEAHQNASGFSIEYAGVGIGFDQASALANAMCDNKFSQSDFVSSQALYRSVIDPAIVQAALECYRLNTKGLHYAIHSDADTHSVSISMYYDGPSPVDVLEIGTVGNAQCTGELFSAWTKDKKISLDTKIRALTCTPKAAEDSPSNADIPAGSIKIFTTAGPIYAQIPRRFSPSLEARFEKMETDLVTMNGVLRGVQDVLRLRVLGAATVKNSKLEMLSSGASMDIPLGRFTFPNPENLKFIAFASTLNNQGGSYATNSCFIRSYNSNDQGPNYVTVWEGPRNTTTGNSPPIDCSVAVIAID